MFLAAAVILVFRVRHVRSLKDRREQKHEQREGFPFALATINMFVQEQIAGIRRRAALMLKKRLFVSNT